MTGKKKASNFLGDSHEPVAAAPSSKEEIALLQQRIGAALKEKADAVEQARRLDELYEAACADIGDLQGKMDRLRAENERLRRASFVEAAENDRLRGQIDSLVEAADAARLLLLFAAGPHEAGAVPAMLAAAIERAKGAK